MTENEYKELCLEYINKLSNELHIARQGSDWEIIAAKERDLAIELGKFEQRFEYNN